MQKNRSNRFIDEFKKDQTQSGNVKHKSDNTVKTSYSPEIFERIQEYNKNLTILDVKYSNLVFTQQILVRCALLEPAVDPVTGFITVPQIVVPMHTSMGITHSHIEKHYAYSRYAVIVSDFPPLELHKGMIVQLDEDAIQILPRGTVKTGFDHKYAYQYNYPTFKETPQPTEPQDENFGYLLIEPRRIITIVPTTVTQNEAKLEQDRTDISSN